MKEKMKPEASAFDTALYLLGFKDRTEKELSDKLRDKGYDEEEIEAAIAKCTEYGYINDCRFAAVYARNRMMQKGDRLIRMELSRKGVSDEVSGSAIDDLSRDESEAGFELLNRRYRGQDLSDDSVRRKAFGFLMRRGFSYDSIRQGMSAYEKKSLDIIHE